MKKQITVLLIAALVLGLLTGCGGQSVGTLSSTNQWDTDGMVAASDAMVRTYEMTGAEEMTMTAAAPQASGVYAAKATGTGVTTLPQNRKWVISISMSAETEDLDAALEAIAAQIGSLDGYVENQNVNNSSSTTRRRRSASMTIRIPAVSVDAFVDDVAGITNVISNSRSVIDITLSYTDTEGRITALKTEESRLLELMAQAGDMSDLLEIEARLTEVRYQLESYSSTLRLYDNQVDYATIDLFINEVEKYTPVEEPGFWQKVTSGLSDSIADLAEALVDLAVWFLVDLPYLILWGLIGWGIWVLIRRRLRRRRAKKLAAKQEEQK